MNIFELTLSPFVLLIRHLFLYGFELTNNYGFAIIILSFAISLLLLPVFIYIEKSKKKDDVIKQKMKPLVDEIKRVYKGQERYYYLKTLNRQHSYSPLRALIPILSLLLQIPFFIAAYQFLEGFEPLSGVAFGFINDLAKPDHLFGYVNILPIAMTMVNLLTAYFYTRHGDGSERKQMLIVAGVFLVLLFNLPSGLVLYWTMNNVFSFFRLFVTNPEVFASRVQPTIHKRAKNKFKSSTSLTKFYHVNRKKIRHAFLVLFGVVFLSQLNWAIQHNFRDFPLRLIVSFPVAMLMAVLFVWLPKQKKQIKHIVSWYSSMPWVVFGFLFFSIYFTIASNFHIGGFNKDLALFALIIATPAQVMGALYLYVKRNKIPWVVLFSLSNFLLLLFIFEILQIIAISKHGLAISILHVDISIVEPHRLFIAKIASFFVLITTLCYLLIEKIRVKQLGYASWGIFLFSGLYLLGFIFLWNPLAVFASFPENFDFAAIDILKNNLDVFVLSFIALCILYLLVPKRIKALFTNTLLVLVVVSFIHNTIIPINVGSLQETKYVDAAHLDIPLLQYFLEVVLFYALIFGIKRLNQQKRVKQIIFVLILLNIVLVAQSFLEVNKTGSLYNKRVIDVNSPSTLSFSKDKENVVFFISDMFQGYYMKDILDRNPELREEWDGFVWYPNTLSMSSFTSTSIGGLLAGLDYNPETMSVDTTHTIGEKITKITEDFRDKVKEKGYRFTSSSMIYSSIDEKSIDTYIPRWHNSWDAYNSILKIGFAVEIGYKLLWENALFYSAPLFLKPAIYKDGKWFHSNLKTNENTNRAKAYNFLRLLPYISEAKSENPSFIYLHTTASHHPWDIINSNGSIQEDVAPIDNNEWVIKSFTQWIRWMKANGVYDNTKIVLVSDHGPHWGHYHGKMDKDLPVYGDLSFNITKEEISCLNALLVVKDYNKQGSIKEDYRFLSNADAMAIAFDENNPLKAKVDTNRLLHAWSCEWIMRIGSEKQFPIRYRYDVKGNYFDLSKWSKLE